MPLTTANTLPQLVSEVNTKATTAYAAANSYVNSTFVIDDPTTVANVKSLVVSNTVLDANGTVLIKKRATTPVRVYISMAGNDTNSGNSSSPFLTLGRAIDEVTKYEYQNTYPVIKFFDGTYDFVGTGNEMYLPKLIGDSSRTPGGTEGFLHGNTTYANGVHINFTGLSRGSNAPGWVNETDTNWNIRGFRFFANTGGILGIRNQSIANVHFAGAPSGYNVTVHGPKMVLTGNVEISNSSQRHLYGWSHEAVLFDWSTTTFTGTPHFSQGYVTSSSGASMTAQNGYTGNATGKRFDVSYGGSVVNGSGLYALPGNAVGTFAGGNYDNFINGKKALTSNNTIIYVGVNQGNDVTGDGSLSNPFKTIRRGVEELTTYYMGNGGPEDKSIGQPSRYKATLKLLDGHYINPSNNSNIITIPECGFNFSLEGNTQYQNNVILTYTHDRGAKPWTPVGLRFRGNGSRVSGLVANTVGGYCLDFRGINCFISNTTFRGLANSRCISCAEKHSSLYPQGTIYISGNCQSVIHAYNGYIESGATINLVGPVKINSGAFVETDGGTIYEYGTISNTATVTGRPFSVFSGGKIPGAWWDNLDQWPGNQVGYIDGGSSLYGATSYGGQVNQWQSNNVTSITISLIPHVYKQEIHFTDVYMNAAGPGQDHWCCRLNVGSGVITTGNNYSSAVMTMWETATDYSSADVWADHNRNELPLDWGFNSSNYWDYIKHYGKITIYGGHMESNTYWTGSNKYWSPFGVTGDTTMWWNQGGTRGNMSAYWERYWSAGTYYGTQADNFEMPTQVRLQFASGYAFNGKFKHFVWA